MNMTTDDTDIDEVDDSATLLDILVVLAENLKWIVLGAVVAGALALGATYLVAPTFTARTSFLPPGQQQSSAASALASLTSLAGFGAGSATGPRSISEQYASLMQSVTVADRLIDGFELLKAYDVDSRTEARKVLAENMRVGVGKRDGMLGVEIDDTDPKRAAALANAVVAELTRLTNSLTVTEAQQRRKFFENQMKQVRDDLARAQQVLQASGVTQATLKAEPKSAAESYARLRAEVMSEDVKLQGLRSVLNDKAPEIRQQQALVAALRAELAKAENATAASNGVDYVSNYREFKYQEMLFEMMARQYELARVDESREGALIQVVDPATPPERKSKPRRAIVALTATALAAFALSVMCVLRFMLGTASRDAAAAEKIVRLRRALHLR